MNHPPYFFFAAPLLILGTRQGKGQAREGYCGVDRAGVRLCRCGYGEGAGQGGERGKGRYTGG